jgi:glycerophosphoryl diester phosphodiesterase
MAGRRVRSWPGGGGQVSLALFGLTHDGPLVIAHRGASRVAPGNSLAAFEAAIDAGCDAVELDVRQTADGVLVVHHAAARRGTPVARLTYQDLVNRSRHVPPRLDEALALCAGRIGLDVEIKDEGIEAAVLSLLAQRFPLNRLLISSFHDTVIAAVKRLDAEVRCGLLVAPTRLQRRGGRREAIAVDLAVSSGADVLLPHQLLTRRVRATRRSGVGLLEAAAAGGLPVITWTVNGPRRMARYLSDQRVAGIITDLPDVALDLRRRLQSSSAIQSS